MAEFHEEEEVLEDISLCDLPVPSISLPNANEEEETSNAVVDPQEEFAFGPTITTGDPLCAADDVFYGGLILPLRPDRAASFAGLSRSSSSSCSSTTRNHRNQQLFHGAHHHRHHPSPKPHVRRSSAAVERASSTVRAKKPVNSSVWDFFRVGLVRTPEVELQELKVSISRANSRSSSGNNSKYSDTVVEKQIRRSKFLSGSGCKCSAQAVASNALISVANKTKLERRKTVDNIRVNNKKKNYGRHDDGDGDDDDDDDGDGDGDRVKQKKQYLKDQIQGRRKQAVSHHRTYEWIKELSHANLVMHV